MHIRFNNQSFHFNRFFERRDGVFGGVSTGAAVSNDDWVLRERGKREKEKKFNRKER
jgi:cysteine synthase